MFSDLLTFLGVSLTVTLYGLIVSETKRPIISYSVAKSKFENFTAVNNFESLTKEEKFIVRKVIMDYRFRNVITEKFIFINMPSRFVYFKIPGNDNEEILSFYVKP